ncbi:MAG: DUF6114 domain-containing protein [Galbitalea sp.]
MLLVTLGLLTMFTPVHRIFYGVISLVVAVYSLIGLNLGGFFVGMLLGAVGGVLTVSWLPKPEPTPAVDGDPRDAHDSEPEKTPAESRPLARRR